MAIEDLREIGNVLYERRADGMLYPVRRVRPDTEARGAPAQDPSLLNVGGIGQRLGLLNQIFNPVEAIGQSMQAGQRLTAPNMGVMDRLAALGDMLSGVAGVTGPAVVAGRAGAPAAAAVMEGLLGGSPTQQAAGDMVRQFGVDESGALRLAMPDPASERGAQIMDMLSSGRADEVTDEMLDMGDPVLNARLNEYLFRNYDLPMDEASRMARAREMGFDVNKIRYTGSEADFNAVNPDMGAGERYRTGLFTSTNPDVADSYASTQGGMIYPMVMRRNDAGAIIDAQGANWNRIPQNSPTFIPSSALAAEFPELAGEKFNTAYDVAPGLFDDLFGKGASTNALARQRRFEGDSNITFENVVDRGPALKQYIGETKEMARAREASASMPSDVRVDFYGNQVRSPFARFDPRLTNLRNLNAALAAAGVPLGLLAMRPEEEQY
jgi:hypothetical protein